MGNSILQLVEAESLRGNFLKSPSPKKQASVVDEKDSYNPGAIPRVITFMPLESLLMISS